MVGEEYQQQQRRGDEETRSRAHRQTETETYTGIHACTDTHELTEGGREGEGGEGWREGGEREGGWGVGRAMEERSVGKGLGERAPTCASALVLAAAPSCTPAQGRVSKRKEG